MLIRQSDQSHDPFPRELILASGTGNLTDIFHFREDLLPLSSKITFASYPQVKINQINKQTLRHIE